MYTQTQIHTNTRRHTPIYGQAESCIKNSILQFSNFVVKLRFWQTLDTGQIQINTASGISYINIGKLSIFNI